MQRSSGVLARLGRRARDRERRAQAQTGLSGIDVSNWQRQIDWVAVAGTGNSFVFAKATESTTFTDLTFPLNRSGSTVLGMRFGAYHMGRPSGSSDSAVVASAIAQADYFLSVATPLKGELLPVLDVEYDGGLSVAAALALGADLARPGRRAHRPQADRLRLAELLEDEAGRLARRRGGRAPAVDRPLDEGCAADPSGRELGRARLVVLAVEQLPEDRRASPAASTATASTDRA